MWSVSYNNGPLPPKFWALQKCQQLPSAYRNIHSIHKMPWTWDFQYNSPPSNYTGWHEFPPCKKKEVTSRVDVAELKYGNQTAPSPTIFEKGLIVNISSLECVPVLSNSVVYVCLFPECFSEVKYVTALPEQIGQLLLHVCVWRVDINRTNEATITTCEETITRFISAVMLAIRTLFGLQKFAAVHV